jgi:hypothetical protein
VRRSELSACRYISKIDARSSAAIPMPVSRTTTVQASSPIGPSARAAAQRTRATICRRRPASEEAGSATVVFSSVVVMALPAEAVRAAAARSSPGRGDPRARRMPSAGARALAGSGRSSVVSDAGGK